MATFTLGADDLDQSLLNDEISRVVGDKTWSFSELRETLKSSELSIPLEELPSLNTILNNSANNEGGFIRKVGNLEVHFPDNLRMTVALFQTILAKLQEPTSNRARVEVDERSGRILLDLGKINGTSGNSPDAATDQEENEEHSEIYKHLEISSYDEYDDFNPRHPMPRDQGRHRRGDSYFNSDVDMIVSEIARNPDFELKAVAAQAALSAEIDDDQEGNDEAVSQAYSVKNRILARAKNNK